MAMNLEVLEKKLMHFIPQELPISSLKGLSSSYLEFFFFTPQELLPGKTQNGRPFPPRNTKTTVWELEDQSSNPDFPPAK